MSVPVTTRQADVVIAGSGPGGATMARELSRRGKKVIVCEAGRYHKRLGATPYILMMMDALGFTFSKEGTWVLRPKTVGGASMVYCGTAWKPPSWFKTRYGIDLEEEVDELYREIPIQPMPDSLIGPAARKIMEAARDLGLDWKPLDKWIRPEKCIPNCGKCMLGCKLGAKWTAREYVEEALQKGAELLTRTKVDRVLTENGRAVGVRARGPEGWMDIRAETVILSAGGQGTPPILQRSGIYDAGKGFFIDPLWFVMAPTPSQGSMYDSDMTAGINLADDGIVLTDLMPPVMVLMALLGLSGPRGWAALPRVIHARHALSIMIKVRDDLDGRINLDESFSKPLDYDTWWRLNKGALLAEEILLKAGAKRDEILMAGIIGAHPGGTVRIGHLLDQNCQTQIQNCYCMDTSVIPEAWGLPPTVTVAALAKRLAKQLAMPGSATAGALVTKAA